LISPIADRVMIYVLPGFSNSDLLSRFDKKGSADR